MRNTYVDEATRIYIDVWARDQEKAGDEYQLHAQRTREGTETSISAGAKNIKAMVVKHMTIHNAQLELQAV